LILRELHRLEGIGRPRLVAEKEPWVADARCGALQLLEFGFRCVHSCKHVMVELQQCFQRFGSAAVPGSGVNT
jgi:hypothetical protein